MFGENLKDVMDISRDFSGYDMSYDQFKEFFWEAWKKDYDDFYNDVTKKKNEKKSIRDEGKPDVFMESLPETNLF